LAALKAGRTETSFPAPEEPSSGAKKRGVALLDVAVGRGAVRAPGLELRQETLLGPKRPDLKSQLLLRGPERAEGPVQRPADVSADPLGLRVQEGASYIRPLFS